MELEFNPILKILKIRTIPKGIHLSFDNIGIQIVRSRPISIRGEDRKVRIAAKKTDLVKG